MRIIGGELGGRRLQAPPASVTRPTTDRVREALASALQARGAFDCERVLDLFAGSGALGLEALSRGAGQVLAVDRDRRAVRCIQDNAEALGVTERVKCLKLDLLTKGSGALQRLEGPFGLLFLDPPYAEVERLGALLSGLLGQGLVATEGLVVVEHASRDALPPVDGLELEASYRYGDSSIALLKPIL